MCVVTAGFGSEEFSVLWWWEISTVCITIVIRGEWLAMPLTCTCSIVHRSPIIRNWFYLQHEQFRTVVVGGHCLSIIMSNIYICYVGKWDGVVGIIGLPHVNKACRIYIEHTLATPPTIRHWLFVKFHKINVYFCRTLNSVVSLYTRKDR